jgi:long-chain acyl-CoA synthetase
VDKRPQTTPATIPGLLAATVAGRGPEAALGAIVGGRLSWLSWSDLAARVAAWRAALAGEFGVAPGDRVAQASPNCLEWVVTDLAVMAAGAVHVPIHASLAAEQAVEHVRHSGSRVVVVRDEAYAKKLQAMLGSDARVALHADVAQAAEAWGSPAAGENESPAPVLSPLDLATILYTSGTTGSPLGVMLSHRNLVSNAVAITDAAAPSGSEVRLGLLPLSHIYARTCDLYSWLVYGGRLVLAESRESVFRDLAIATPSAINAVPYFYQKVVDRLRDGDGDGNMGAAELRTVLGGAIERCYCGGAALAPEVDRFFAERGLPILCGYGLTEAAPVISATTPGGYRSGTVGPPLEGVEVRLADDGEVLARGPNIMAGYWQDPDATARVVRDGWLLTGDVGQWDAAGHLRIVGRKKEMIVLATGKKVAPTLVEDRLAGSPWIEQACVVGDGRKCLAALVVPNGDALRREIKRRRLWVWSRRRALNHPQVLALFRQEIDRVLTGLAEFEQVGAFTLIGRVFSLAEDEVTPKLSLRRATIAEHFAADIEAMYRKLAKSNTC